MQLILDIENSSYILVLVIRKLLVAFANSSFARASKATLCST